jgi:hypothetical protein
VCPSQADLRSLPNEEISLRISSYNQLYQESNPSFVKYEDSPSRYELEEVEDKQHKLAEFNLFAQPSLQDMLEDIQESSSLWNNLE